MAATGQNTGFVWWTSTTSIKRERLVEDAGSKIVDAQQLAAAPSLPLQASRLPSAILQQRLCQAHKGLHHLPMVVRNSYIFLTFGLSPLPQLGK